MWIEIDPSDLKIISCQIRSVDSSKVELESGKTSLSRKDPNRKREVDQNNSLE